MNTLYQILSNRLTKTKRDIFWGTDHLVRMSICPIIFPKIQQNSSDKYGRIKSYIEVALRRKFYVY